MRPALLVACALLLAAAPAAQNPPEPLSCESARAELEKHLDTFPRSCQRDSDCEGYYYRADACAPAVVARKHRLAGKREQRLLALQHEVGEACALKWRMRRACSPIPFRAVCRQHACVDALGGMPSPEPATQPTSAWPFATIRHACGPTDGPALQITLRKLEKPVKDGALLFLNLYGKPAEPPFSTPLTLELEHGQSGDGVRCMGKKPCETAERGQVVLEKFDGTGVEGSYELFFKDGSRERGRFKAAWKEVREACG